MATIKTDQDFMRGNMEPQPRMRINRTATLVLTTNFQRIDFNGTSSLNLNSFPTLENSKKGVDWDATNKLLIFGDVVDRNFAVRMTFQFNGGLRPVDIYLRFVVPSPVPLYFPFPNKADDASLNGRGYVNVATMERLSDFGCVYVEELYSNALSRQYGVGVEMRSGLTLATQPSLLKTDLIVYGR